MKVNRRKTTEYYKNISGSELCSCAYCRLYRRRAKQAFPALSRWLESYGAEIDKPFEVMWLDPDENGMVEYIGVQYILFGTCEEDAELIIGNMTIRRTDSFPEPTGVEGEFFVMEVYPLFLSVER